MSQRKVTSEKGAAQVGETLPARRAGAGTSPSKPKQPQDPFLRAPNEDDDGYDPYSDRPAKAEPLFMEDPWR